MSEARKRLEDRVQDRLAQVRALGLRQEAASTVWVPIADLRTADDRTLLPVIGVFIGIGLMLAGGLSK